jgi:hypothetical protein
MTLKIARIKIDRASLPQQRSDLGVRFQRHTVTPIKNTRPPKDMVLILPASNLLAEDASVGPEPAWNHVLCGMKLRAGDGTEAQGTGQLLITGRRFIGMIDTGTAAGSAPLALETSGNVFCFTFDRDDVYAPKMDKHRLTPSDFSFRSKEELAVGFQFTVYSAAAYVANSKMSYWHDKNMLYALSDEGRQGLLTPASQS